MRFKWEIDKVTGKKGVLIGVDLHTEQVALNFTPSEKFINKLVDWWLECEQDNGRFEFEKPVHDRWSPPELSAKIKKLQKILDKYIWK